jgi:hypothetical protein
MFLNKLRHTRQGQRGYFLVGLSVAILAMSVLVLGGARTTLNNFKESIGAGLGNQLQTVNTALVSYISANSTALIANTAITGVSNIYLPTIAELKALGHLNITAQPTPTAGTAYVINIALQPLGCTTTCVPVGYVYLQTPIVGPDGKTADVRLLSAAMNASKTNQVGFSQREGASATTGTITGNGWTFENPDPSQRPGILYATTNLSGTNAPTATASGDGQVWKAPGATYAALPMTGNTLGDGRYVLDTNKPFVWGGTSWQEAFVHPTTKNIVFDSTQQSNGSWEYEHYLTAYDGASRSIGVGNAAGTWWGMNTGPWGPGTSADLIAIGTAIHALAGNRNTVIVTGQNIFSGGTDNVFLESNGSYNGGNTEWGDSNVFAGTSLGEYGGAATNTVAVGYGSKPLGVSVKNCTQIDNLGWGAPTRDDSNCDGVISIGNSSYEFSDAIYIGRQAGHWGHWLGSYWNWNNVPRAPEQGPIFIGWRAYEDSLTYWYQILPNYRTYSVTVGRETGWPAIFGLGWSASNPHGGASVVIGEGAAVDARSWSYDPYQVVDPKHFTVIGHNGYLGTVNNLDNNITHIGTGLFHSQYEDPSTRPAFTDYVMTFGQWIGGQVAWSNVSDRRAKRDIHDSSRGLDFIRKLKSVDYVLKDSNKVETGFIAQDVEAADPSFPGLHKPKGDKGMYSLMYTSFIPAIVKSIQEIDERTIAAQEVRDAQSMMNRWLFLAGALVASALAWIALSQRRLSKEMNALTASLACRST